MHKTLLYVVKGTETNQPRLIQRALRQNVSLRKYITAPQVCVVKICHELHCRGHGRYRWKVGSRGMKRTCGVVCLECSSFSPFSSLPPLFLAPTPIFSSPFSLPQHPPFSTVPLRQLETLIKRHFPEGHVGAATFAPYVAKIREHEGKFWSIHTHIRTCLAGRATHVLLVSEGP